jgi:hypothetical protein
LSYTVNREFSTRQCVTVLYYRDRHSLIQSRHCFSSRVSWMHCIFGGTRQRMFRQTIHIFSLWIQKILSRKCFSVPYFILTTRVQLSNALRAVELQCDAKQDAKWHQCVLPFCPCVSKQDDQVSWVSTSQNEELWCISKMHNSQRASWLVGALCWLWYSQSEEIIYFLTEKKSSWKASSRWHATDLWRLNACHGWLQDKLLVEDTFSM